MTAEAIEETTKTKNIFKDMELDIDNANLDEVTANFTTILPPLSLLTFH